MWNVWLRVYKIIIDMIASEDGNDIYVAERVGSMLKKGFLEVDKVVCTKEGIPHM